jgi:hypothetical protein
MTDRSTATRGSEITEDALIALFDQISNAGRWGPDDELGTLNFITNQKRVAAAKLVVSGDVVSLGLDLDTAQSQNNHHPVVHQMLLCDDLDATGQPLAAFDAVTITPHGMTMTHLDALGHANFEGHLYNGRHVKDAIRAHGLSFGSIYAMRDGIVTRGVLLDVAAARGVAWLSPDEGVWPEDLEAAERLAGVRVQSGDAIFVRVGLRAREAVEGPEDLSKRAGLVAECIPWLHEREVALYSGDCFEFIPSPYPRMVVPLHVAGLCYMGMPLLDNPAVEQLAETAHRLRRFEFMFSCAPVRLPRGTGAAVNPLAVF